MSTVKKLVKRITIDVDKCGGCRSCELICSAFHATPRYSSFNPSRARIHVITDPLRNLDVPVIAREVTSATGMVRDRYVIDGKLYDESGLSGAELTSTTLFREPDSGLPLQCDMCDGNATPERPLCVQWCINGALIYEEVEA